MSKFPMTAAGVEKLRQELQRLITVERPRIIQAIADARALGDLSENAEYHAAREQQGFIEGRIAELEHTLSLVQIIDPRAVSAEGRVVFGATVKIADEDTGQEQTYQIVGDYEADLAQNRISVSSPMARALIGKRIGDVVEVKLPAGAKSYEIVDVRYL